VEVVMEELELIVHGCEVRYEHSLPVRNLLPLASLVQQASVREGKRVF
jgi:hypothetical protein